MKNFLRSKITLRCIAAILVAAALAFLLPVAAREHAHPEYPEQPEIHELAVISAGTERSNGAEEVSGDTDEDESGSAGKPGGTEGTDGGSRVNLQETDGAGGVSLEEKEVNVTGSQSGGTGEDTEEPNTSSDLDFSDSETGTNPSDPDRNDKTEDGNTGEDGGETGDIDLGAVLTWYKYGNQPAAVVCAPYGAAEGRVLKAQLTGGRFSYRIDLTGDDSSGGRITEVTVRQNNGAEEKSGISGNMDMVLGEGGSGSSYVFTVHADIDRRNAEGDSVHENVTFIFVMKYEDSIDLELYMTWTKAGGGTGNAVCAPGGTAEAAVKNTELTDGALAYELSLDGSAAGMAEIVSAEYTSGSGAAGALETSGKLVMSAPDGSSGEKYTVTVCAKVDSADAGGSVEVVFTIVLDYSISADVELEFIWYKKSTTAQTVICGMNGAESVTIKHNELNNNSLQYHIALVGEDASGARIVSARITGNSGTKDMDYPQGSVNLAQGSGAASAVYRVQVTAEIKTGGEKETVSFNITVTYASDVSLEIVYFTGTGSATSEHVIRCENNRVKTSDIIFNDQLDGGKLPFTMSISGDDSGGVTIQKVSMYRSGDMKNIVLSGNVGSTNYTGTAALLLNDGRMGENRFTVTAQSNDGTKYSFSVNFPYMPRGDKEVVIKTNITDGQTVENETFFDLTVNAYSVDESGNVISHIRAIGSETELRVTLDGETVTYSGTSGNTVQYRLYPKNPEVGDHNTHELVIYARDEYGNEATKTYSLDGRRTVDGDVIGKAKIYVDLTVLGLGVYGPVDYDVMANEPVSYVVAKTVWGEDTGEPYGQAASTLGWDKTRCSYGGTLDIGFYLRGLGDGSNMGARAKAVTAVSFESLGGTEEEILAAIDAKMGAGSSLSILWRCIYRNGIPLMSPSSYSIREFDYTKGSGWVYAVNGFYPGASMSDYTLRDGDTLTLRYTLAYGWDIGGGDSSGYGNTVGYCISCANGTYSVSHRYETVINADGSVVYRCRCCGMVQECPHEHTEWKDNGDGTCGEFCNDCGRYINDLTEHEWEYSQDGAGERHVKTCTRCGASEEEEHCWLYGESTATCTEDGTVDMECEICGFKKTAADPAKGHIYSDIWQVTAAEHYQKCQVCGAEISGTRGSHEYEADGAGGWECTVCRAYHEWDCGGSLTLAAGDCVKRTYVCGKCGLTLVEYGSFHSYENGVCTVCGEAEPGYVPPDQEETEPTA